MRYRYEKLGLGSPMKTAVKRAHFSCRAPVPYRSVQWAVPRGELPQKFDTKPGQAYHAACAFYL